MPEYLRAFVVILILSSVLFTFAKSPATAVAITTDDFARRRNCWFWLVCAAFLSQNIWLFSLLACVILILAAQKEQNRVAMFFFVLLALPQVPAEVPGFSGIRYLVNIDYVKILALVLLLPVCIDARRRALASKAKALWPDKVLAIYMVLSLVLMARDDVLTNVLRALFDWTVGVIIPYYAISRSLRDMKRFRDTLMSIIVATLVVCVIGGFEFLRHWILYGTLGDALGTTFTPGYLGRGDYLRASATSGQAIVLGYVVASAIGLYLCMDKMVPNRWAYRAGAALLIVGIVAPLSRGPWIGMTAMVLLFILAGKNVVKQIVKLAAMLGLVLATLALTGNSDAVIQFLPFVGNIDEFNVSYRQQLFDRSIQLTLENPFFGSNTFLSKMEDLRQGQGIIDLVNTYIIVALNTGLVGLTLFVSFFAWILVAVAKGVRSARTDADTQQLGQALFVTLAGVLIMIFSVSTVYHVPIYLWSIAAMGVAYHRMCSQPAQQQSVRPPGQTKPKGNEKQRTQFLVE
jgi:hypothetical protein